MLVDWNETDLRELTGAPARTKSELISLGSSLILSWCQRERAGQHSLGKEDGDDSSLVGG